jgi:hypothetical protein
LRSKNIHPALVSSRFGEAKIPAPIFTKAENEAGAERFDGRFDPPLSK